MESILLALLTFSQLSTQFPTPLKSSTLVARGHTESPYTSNLQRHRHYGGAKLSKRQSTVGSGPITDNQRVKFLTPLSFGSQTLLAEVDTGSSDTWLIQDSYQCYTTFDRTTQQFEDPQPDSTCNFGAGYTPDSDFATISTEYELSCYGESGEGSLRCVAGPLGTAPVTLAGLTVPEQVVGAPNLSSQKAPGDAEQSGIIGMAFPVLTSALSSADNTPVPYNSIMDTIFNVDTFDPPLDSLFSLTISRDASGTGNGGILAIGGVPTLSDPTVNVSSTFTSAPFQPFASVSSSELSFYSIIIDGYVFGGSTSDAGTQVIIDSGADVVELPTATANAVNSLWSPAPDTNGNLDCSATLTEPFGIAIGGATYYITPGDLLFDNGDGTCSSLISGTDSGQYLIGDPLLKNTLAVYDWGNSQMSFYPRMVYDS